MSDATLFGSFVAVGAGGTLGALLRGFVFHSVARQQRRSPRPDSSLAALAGATLGVNCAGSLVLGFCVGIGASGGLSEVGQLFWITGIGGSMTTFSTLCADAMRLSATLTRAAQLVYLGAHVICGLGVFTLGRLLARVLWP